jgi:23S rRNA pseudouridine1911/1915/1917 synthase
LNENKKFQIMTLNPEMVGLRADKALSLFSEVGSRNKAEWLIENSRVLINGRTPKRSHVISDLDSIEISFPEPQPSTLTPLQLDLDIKYEDADLIVINKPAGLVIHPAAGHEQDTLVNALLAHTTQLSMRFGEQRPGIVHRLDKETSGLLVVAKNDASHESLANQFRDRKTHRIYNAACLGVTPLLNGRIQSSLARHPVDRKRYASQRGPDGKIIHEMSVAHESGKWAITNYKTLKRTPAGISYFELKLETGRTHQIRVHLSELGCPIIADNLYGADRKIKALKGNHDRDVVQKFPRFALHAAELGFEHPKSKQAMLFKAPWPQDLKPLLEELKLLDNQ